MKQRLIAAAVAAVQMMVAGAAAFAEEENYIEKFEEIRSDVLPQIEELIRQCEEKKIFVDYEKADCRVVEKFIDLGINDASPVHKTAQERGLILSEYVGYGNEDLTSDKTARAAGIYEIISELADDTIKRLQSYLDGSAEPKGDVVKYVTSDVKTDGLSFVATNEKGEEKPIFFTGYGHFAEAMTDIPIFADMGVNIVEIELGIMHVVEMNEDGSFYFNPESEYFQTMLQLFDTAAESNVGINLLLSPHYIPNWFYEKFPDDAKNSYFTDTEAMRALLRVYIDGVIEYVKDKPALHSICLTNEGNYKATDEVNDLPKYIDYLKELYNNDISALNENYGSEYTSFDEIKFPNTDLAYFPEDNLEAMPQIWDFLDFNDKNYAEIHKFMYDIILEKAPDVLAGAKVMQPYDCDERDWMRQFLFFGTDPEEYGKVLTINGNDANNYLDPQDYQWDINNKMSYYDLQTSVNDAPVFDFEDHVIRDRNDRYNIPEMVDHVASDVWQGAVHGRGGTTIWVWERSYDESHDFSGSILNRPDVVAEASNTMLDLNRLSDEVTLLENAERNIGILYSQTARLYSLYYINSMMKAYESASYTGERVNFVTEPQAAEGKLLQSDIQVLVIPYATHLTDETVEAVNEFIDNGGKVIVVGEDTITHNQYNKEIDKTLRDGIFNRSTVLPAEKMYDYQVVKPDNAELFDTLLGQLDKSEDVVLTDASTGEPIYGVSYTWTRDNGAVLLNICNYELGSDKVVNVNYKGRQIEDGAELRNMEVLSLQGLTLEPKKPILIKFSDGVFADTVGHWAENDIMGLWNKNVVGSAEAFEPDSGVTAGEFAGLLENAKGVDAETVLGGKDPNEALTREEMAKMLVTVCNEKGIEVTQADISAFSDNTEIVDKDSVSAAVGTGLMSGMPDMTFAPLKNATKAEAASVVLRIPGC